MKLNYKRTILVGFAFFLICAFWQAYDNTIPLILTNKFGMSQTWSGVIMALDNILALFLLPLFGAISDRSHSKKGRRTPRFLGKPRPDMVYLSMARTGFPPAQTVLLGDRLYTDIACGVNAGIDTVFVLSGEGTEADIEKFGVHPTWVRRDIAEILQELQKTEEN